MSSEIQLSELIQQVKQELLATNQNSQDDLPVFSVDSVELELQVTVKKEGNGGIKVNVLPFLPVGGGEVSGKVSQDHIQKVIVKLSPLLDKELMVKHYIQNHPEKVQKLLDQNSRAILKGPDGL